MGIARPSLGGLSGQHLYGHGGHQNRRFPKPSLDGLGPPPLAVYSDGTGRLVLRSGSIGNDLFLQEDRLLAVADSELEGTVYENGQGNAHFQKCIFSVLQLSDPVR